MANLKHIGRVSNTGLKCIVVFREMYDEHGKVLDPNHCLIVETERLPDMEHDDIVRVVESDSAQVGTLRPSLSNTYLQRSHSR